jgi:hypothetical protein
MFRIVLPEKDDPKRAEAIASLSWMLRGFLISIKAAYTEDAPRRIEAKEKCRHILEQLQPSVSEDEWQKLCYGILP